MKWRSLLFFAHGDKPAERLERAALALWQPLARASLNFTWEIITDLPKKGKSCVSVRRAAAAAETCRENSAVQTPDVIWPPEFWNKTKCTEKWFHLINVPSTRTVLLPVPNGTQSRSFFCAKKIASRVRFARGSMVLNSQFSQLPQLRYPHRKSRVHDSGGDVDSLLDTSDSDDTSIDPPWVR